MIYYLRNLLLELLKQNVECYIGGVEMNIEVVRGGGISKLLNMLIYYVALYMDNVEEPYMKLRKIIEKYHDRCNRDKNYDMYLLYRAEDCLNILYNFYVIDRR